jgi:hypothetical protein
MVRLQASEGNVAVGFAVLRIQVPPLQMEIILILPTPKLLVLRKQGIPASFAT